MATVTGMTAAAMQAIRDGTVVSAHFDSANHLILVKYDATQVDAGLVGASTTTLAGVVELATSAETQTGTDTTRAVTPAALASLPGYRVQIVSGLAETDTPASWPYGVALQSVTTGSGWSLNGGFGTIITSSISSSRTVQEFYKSSGGTSIVQSWERTYNASDGGGGWTAWRERNLLTTLTAASFTQTTALSSYPVGNSRLYYAAGTAGSWDFASIAPGEVMTFKEGTDFARQEFTSHASGSGKPVQWFRTANAASSWTAWQPVITDQGAWTAYTPVWTTSGTAPAIGNGTISGRYTKIGRTIIGTINLTAGSTTTYGSGGFTFTLPPFAASASANTTVGSVQLLDGTTRYAGQMVITASATTSGLYLPSSSTDNRFAAFSATSPMALTTSAQFRCSFSYETAT